MARLLMHGGDRLLVRTLGQAEDLSRLLIQPVARVLDPSSLLRLEILFMRLRQLLRRDVHPLVYVHECRHEPTSYAA